MTVAEALSVVEGEKKGPSRHDEPLSPSRIANVRERLQSITEVSDKELAKATGFSLSTINLFRNNRYNGDSGKVARAIEEYLTLLEAQKLVGGTTEFVKTSIARKIERAIFVAEATRRISVIAAQAGLGKTLTIGQYRLRQAGKARSVYVSCSPDLNNIWLILQELYFAVTRSENGKKSQLRRELVHILQGTNRTIFIDEAQHLAPDSLELLRCIADQANVAMVLSGNESIYEHGSSSGARRSASAHAQFSSRVVQRVHLQCEDITTGDVKAIATQFVPAATLAETIDLLTEETRGMGRSTGGFRRLVTILTLAQIAAAGREVRKAHVVRAIRDLEAMSDDGGDA